MRQLNNTDHYEELDQVPTKRYQKQIIECVKQAISMNIINNEIYKNLVNKHCRITTFYILPRIHKPSIPGRPIVNGIGTITEKLSAYVDHHIRPLVPNIPTYVKNTTQFLNLIKDIEIQSQELLETIDVSILYMHIPHMESIIAINKILEENSTDPFMNTFICRLTHHILTKNNFKNNGRISHQ